ncbi:hypothetical protein LXM94_23360 [Rhizobium sp. TRM95111]|uniref:hypothetical protein n=1 Tax=Rhizobium alarense TaxID=2846851 RepID=UPI001F1A961A|nr:hypothetical protein [Rhizobium alarense]MCF3642908.1 hypothetical protein [Rhizobium alarense]
MQAHDTSHPQGKASGDPKAIVGDSIDRVLDQVAVLSVAILAADQLYERQSATPEDCSVLLGLGCLLRGTRRTLERIGEDLDHASGKMGGRHAR